MIGGGKSCAIRLGAMFLIFSLFVLFSGCKSGECARKLEIDYSKFDLARCESKILNWKIKHGSHIYLPDSLTTITRNMLPYLFYSFPITIYKGVIIYENYRKKCDSTVMTFIDTNGAVLRRYGLKGIFHSLQIVNDTLLLCTKVDIYSGRTEGVLINDRGNAVKKYFFLLDPRFLIHYRIFDNYVFTVGFEDLKDSASYNRGFGCYSLDNWKHLADGALYPCKIYEAICIDVAKVAQFIVKRDTVFGVLTYAPIFFKHSISDDKEKQYLLPFYRDFAIWDFRNCDYLNSATELLYKYNWSYQYYANMLNDSVMYIFRVIRGKDPKFFIDFYDYESEPPVYLGSVKVDEQFEPLCGWEDRIILLDRKLLLERNKARIVSGHIQYG